MNARRGKRQQGARRGVNREPELATLFKVLFDAGDSAPALLRPHHAQGTETTPTPSLGKVTAAGNKVQAKVLTALSKSMESCKHKGYDAARHQIQIRVPVIGIALCSKLDVGSRAVRKDKEIGACDVNFTS